MTDECDVAGERPLPRFFTEWRGDFGPDADFSPLDHLNQGAAVPFVLAAQWLFCPTFVEYEGCVVVVKNDHGEGGRSEADRIVVDEWRSV